MGRKIGIVSAKGGVGKTVIAVNLASALSERSGNVIAIDADVKMTGLSLQLGMYQFPVTLHDIASGKRSALESIYIHSSGVRIMPASMGMDRKINTARLRKVLDDPAIADSTAIIDCPPGLEKNSLDAMKCCEEAIVVTTPEIPSLIDNLKAIEMARRSGVKVLGVVVNRYRKGRDQILLEEIRSVSGLPLVGTIPEDDLLVKSVFQRTPLVVSHPKSRASAEFRRLAGFISGEKTKRRFAWAGR